MPRRSKAELLAEYHRLCDAVEISHEALCRMEPEWRQFPGPTPREVYLSLVDRGETTLSECIAGAREALTDLAPRGSPYPEEAAREARFLALYTEVSGRSYWEDCTRPGAQAKAILRRGYLADETEWRLLESILADVSQTILNARGIEKANEMLSEFESNNG